MHIYICIYRTNFRLSDPLSNNFLTLGPNIYMYIFQLPRGNWISQPRSGAKALFMRIWWVLWEKKERGKGSGPGPGNLSHLPITAFLRIPGMSRTPCKVWRSWGFWTMAYWLMIERKGQWRVWPVWSCKESLSDEAPGKLRKAAMTLLSSCTSGAVPSPTPIARQENRNPNS